MFCFSFRGADFQSVNTRNYLVTLTDQVLKEFNLIHRLSNSIVGYERLCPLDLIYFFVLFKIAVGKVTYYAMTFSLTCFLMT